MSNDTQTPVVDTQVSSSTEEAQVHPVLAEILSEKEPDTVSWVKA